MKGKCMNKLSVLKKVIGDKNIKAGFWYTASNILNKAIGFLTMPIFTRLLIPEEYGIVNTYLAWVGVIGIVIGLFLYSSVMTAVKDYKDNIDDYMSSVLFLSFISFICIGSLIFSSVIFFHVNVPILIVVFAILQAYSEFILTFYCQKLIMDEKYKLYSVLNSAIPIFNVIISLMLIFTVMNNDRSMARIFSAFFVEAVEAIVIACIILCKSRKVINIEYWKYALKYSLPLIVHGGALYILAQSDRLMITHFVGSEQTGIYSLVYNFGMIAQMVATSLNNIWMPFFATNVCNASNKEIDKKAKLFTNLFAIITVIILLISPEAIKIMASSKYWSGIPMLIPITLSAFVMFIYSFYANTERYYKKTVIVSVCTLIGAAVNVVLNFYFIPLYGSLAAAYSTLIAYFVSAVIHYFVARRCNNMCLHIKIFSKSLLMVITVSIVAIFLQEHFILRWIIALVCILGYGLGLMKSFIKDRI